jgi:hypothetical protein
VPWYIRLADGRRLEGHAENGMLKPGELDDKFLRLTRKTLGARGSAALFERLRQLEDEENLQGARRSAVALDGGLHARQALVQVIGSHDRHQLDLGVHTKEEPFGDIGDLR